MSERAGSLDLDRIRSGQLIEVHLDNQLKPLVFSLSLALSLSQRTRGLIGAPPLEPGEGMLLRPCNAIHTFFMGQTIDAAMLDHGGRVLALHRQLQPWRVTLPTAGALATLELPGGTFEQRGLRLGETLRFVGR